MAYKGISAALLEKHGAKVGDRISFKARDGSFDGIVMPRAELGDEHHLVLKLVNGYNVGVFVDGTEKLHRFEEQREVGKFHKKEITFKKGKPLLSIIHTGGTIASRVDYRTGGVVSAFTPEELLDLFPELDKMTNLRATLISNMFSEDIEPDHCTAMAKQIEKEIAAGSQGIVITHGTDTLAVSAAMVSFMAQNLPVPVAFVGSQRSSDRGSSDAEMNLMCAANFALNADFAGVTVCMHGTTSDDYCLVHEGTKVRKMHSSRRDAFRSINQRPWARVWRNGTVDFMRKDNLRRDATRKPLIREKFERKVALLKSYNDFDPELINYFTDKKYKGLVLEGTGLGHVPINDLDAATHKHKTTFENLKRFVDSGGIAVMTSQCLYGRINMNVYSTGRDLLKIGVLPGSDMLPETALVKLKWVLAQTSDVEKARGLMLTNMAGEITERTDPTTFIDQGCDNSMVPE
ncbi:Glutamyl-tRNA(Gln) amidotransferase subunit D [Candidatus Norongarragalina meridionalis]|nr:Glutamyl-tRNA(Gln) amidotransferase subunit D [Candidatus Norongarragalina meridionalis]